MSPVAIVTDSTAYIPTDLLKTYQIKVAPLQVVWDGKSFRDGVDITPAQFYTRLGTSKSMPSTSQPTPADFLAIYEELAGQGYEILSIHISSSLSGTMDSAIQAREMVASPANIEVVDSRSAGMGLGYQALAAARAREDGADFKDIIATAEQAVQNSGVLFIPATLEFLHRGGRIGGGQAFFGKLLDVKPILGIRDGKIEAIDKARTKARAIERMVDIVVSEVGDRRPVRIATLHANAPELSREVLDKACSRFKPGEVAEAISTDVSPAIGTHLGPGGLGLCYLAGM